MKKKLTFIVILLFPSFLMSFFLRLLGHKIGKRVKIGVSIIYVDFLELGDNSQIGHLNLILNKSFKLKTYSLIGYLNILKGPFDLILESKAAIGNKNYLTRAKKGVTYGDASLVIGNGSKITVSHHLDLTKSITLGKNSIIAGINSQLWTHGYYHANLGPDRIRIDGEVHIGNNVYVGSGCIFNPGITVGNAIHIGAGSVISKDLIESGMYVGQALRFIDNNLDTIKSKLKKVEEPGLVEIVYTKN